MFTQYIFRIKLIIHAALVTVVYEFRGYPCLEGIRRGAESLRPVLSWLGREFITMFSRGRGAKRGMDDDVVPFVDGADTVMWATEGHRQDNAHAPQQVSAKDGLQIHSRGGTSWKETEPQALEQLDCVHDLSDTTSDEAGQPKKQEAWGRFPDMDLSGQVYDGLGDKNTPLLDLQGEGDHLHSSFPFCFMSPPTWRTQVVLQNCC